MHPKSWAKQEETAQREEDAAEIGQMSKKKFLYDLSSLVVQLIIEEAELKVKKNDVPSQKNRKKALKSNIVAKRRSYERASAIIKTTRLLIMEEVVQNQSMQCVR